MSLIRAAFIFALLTPVVGVLGSRYLITKLVGQAPQPALAPAPPTPRPTRTQVPTVAPTLVPTREPTPPPTVAPTTQPPTALPTTAPPAATTAPRPAATPRRRASVAVRRPSRARVKHRHPSVSRRHTAARARPRHRTIVRARPTPTAGTVTLTRYWISTTLAHRGSTIGVGYVIDNETGRTDAIMLGASVKSTSTLSWLAAINDTSHDVIATVPPGVSTHSRFFTLPTRLRPGLYDVAWGLRDAGTGASDAVVSADGVLRVTH